MIDTFAFAVSNDTLVGIVLILAVIALLLFILRR